MPVWTPEKDVELASAIEQRAKETAAAKPPSKDDKGSTPPPAATLDKPKDVEGSGGASSAAAPEDKANAPKGNGPLDLSFLPEKLRSKIHVDDEEGAVLLKSGFEAHATVTRTRQELNQYKRDAENYRDLVKNPRGLLDLAKAAGVEVPSAAEPAPEPEVDWSDPKAVDAHIDRKVERRLQAEEQARQRAEAEKAALIAQKRQSVNDALEAWKAENSIDEAMMTEAVKAVDADLRAAGETWNPKLAPILVGKQVDLLRLKKAAAPPPANKNGSTNGNPGLEAVASPVGRGGPHSEQPVPFPSFFVPGGPDGKKPPNRPLSDAERDELHLFKMRLRFGAGVTPEMIRAASK